MGYEVLVGRRRVEIEGREITAEPITGYETVEPWPLERIDAPEENPRKAGLGPKAILSVRPKRY
jgi:hypothetical protein